MSGRFWEKVLQLLLALIVFTLFVVFTQAEAATVAWGSKGEQVRLVQEKLKQYGDFKGTVDGIFGKETYDAVVRFQRKNGLAVDGVVGKATYKALGMNSSEYL